LYRGYTSVWLGRRRERDILNLSEKHFKKIIDLATLLKNFMKAFVENNLEEKEKIFKEIFKVEREADDAKESIIVELSKGPFHPMDREDIMRLILTMDDIASNIKASSRKLMYVDSSDIPDELKRDILELTNMVFESIRRLGEALKALVEGSKDVLALADSVEREEEAIDEFRVGLIARVLKWGEGAKKISLLLMLKEAIENLEAAADKTEDVADIIRVIVAG
jgi:predicted phosphate transport protein (TIGR00153 family)